MRLSVGSTYQLYTKYESIAGEKVQVVGTLAYSECSKVSYNMTVLAINERIISVKEENLEEFIGSDTIYHCRAVNANSDGTYSEYVVWDGVINIDKTVKINETYNYTLSIKVLDSTNIPISQVISSIEKYISNNFSKTVEATISDETTSYSTHSSDTVSDEKIEKIEAILNKIATFEHKLIPAAEKITSLSLAESIEEVSNSIDEINKNITIIAQNV